MALATKIPFTESTAPDQRNNVGTIFVDIADGKIKVMNSAGNIVDLTAGGGGAPSAVVNFYDATGIPNAPINIVIRRMLTACTLTNVRGYRIGGTGATVNARKNGALLNLAVDLSLTAADTWMDGGAVQNASYAIGDTLEAMLVTAADLPTELVIQLDFTIP